MSPNKDSKKIGPTIKQAKISELNYTVLLCVDYDEQVLKRYNELLKSCTIEGGYTQNFGYINRRRLRISPTRTIQYNLILGLGGEDAADIAKRIYEEEGEIAVAFFDLATSSDKIFAAIGDIKKIFPSLICAVAIKDKEEDYTSPAELFSSPSEWLYFFSDYRPEQMEQLIAHLISSFVLHREKEKALTLNEETRKGLRQILTASPDLLKRQSERELAEIILKNLLQLTDAKSTFLVTWNQEKGQLSYIAGTGKFSTKEEFTRLGYYEKRDLYEIALVGNKIFRFRDGVLAPLLVQDKKIGLLFLDEENSVTKESELLDVFAHHVAFALENQKMLLEIEAKKSLEHELDLASRIQSSLLPKSFPEIPGLEIYGVNQSAKEIGGDYFDVISAGGNYYFCIGDVSGKGVPAGLIMSELRSIVRSFAMIYDSPREILLNTAELLSKDIGGSGKFVSMLLFKWDGQKIVYSSAGHEHIIHYHVVTGECDAYRSGGVVLGANMKHFARLLKEKELPWTPGDVVMLFTDGATEARTVDKEMFKLSNLQTAVKQYNQFPVKEMTEAILQEILDFMGKAEQHDDITLLGLKYKRNIYTH